MDRKSQILMAIIESHIKNWTPVWSSFLNNIYDFKVSSATIRKEMNKLEMQWFIDQPHTSSWRIPTASWYKEYLSCMLEMPEIERDKIRKEFGKRCSEYYLKKARERVYDVVSIASSMSWNIAFATIPEKTSTIYLWLANMLRQPEFEDSQIASSVVEVFEWWLISKLDNVDISDNKVGVYIWDDNIFKQFSSCSLLAIKYKSYNYCWVIWILWPMRIKYAHSIVVLEEAKSMIEGDNYIKKLT